MRVDELFIEFPKTEIEQSIVTRFDRQVLKYPDRMALCSDDLALNYSELDILSDAIALEILSVRGARPEPVGILLPPGRLAIGMLAVLKSGKYYVPIDPFQDDNSKLAVIDDSGMALLITEQALLPAAKNLNTGDLILIDNGKKRTQPSGTALHTVLMNADSLACVLYTSGTIGMPKGVIYSHRNVLHMIMDNTNSLGICCNDRIALLSSSAFVGSTASIFRALLNGAVLYPFDLKQNSVAPLAGWLVEKRITLVQLVPTVYRHMLLTMQDSQTIDCLRILHLAGEPVNGLDLRAFKKRFSPGTCLINELGATETGAISRYFADHQTGDHPSMLPVGEAAADKVIRLIDDSGNEVPGDQIGEIEVASKFLPLGYWQKPQLTNDKFKPDSDGKSYATGDLGKISGRDGLIHLGRKDAQVKVRGYRVNLVKIEVACLALGYFSQAVVTVPPGSGESGLTAYLIPDSRPPVIGEIRKELARELPDYMIPSKFVFLKKLPLTATGKVDRNSLPMPENQRPQLKVQWVAPRTKTEKELARLSCNYLKINVIGVYDDFIELGMDSLMAGDLINGIAGKFSVELSYQRFFDNRNIANLASFIDGSRE